MEIDSMPNSQTQPRLQSGTVNSLSLIHSTPKNALNAALKPSPPKPT